MIASFDIGEKNFAFCIGTDERVEKFFHANVIRKKSQTVLDSCREISLILDAHFDEFTRCTKVLIERQLTRNIRAQCIAQHVWTWFFIMLPQCEPEFVRASLKTQHFLGTNSLTNKGRKIWATNYVLTLLRDRNDTVNLNYINSLPKQDDVADTYLQLVAYYNNKKTNC